MKQNKLLSIAMGVLSLSACADWSDHYDELPTQGTGLTVMELLDRNTPDFAAQVLQAGYADLLASSQSFTVFAPAQGIGTGDVHQMVANHIARRVYPTSTPQTAHVEMLNGKIYEFDATGGFAGTAITQGNLKADNGLVHQLLAPITYRHNIYEHLQSRPEFSEVYNFIRQFDEVKFDVEASTEIDIDAQGRPVYDSVMVSYNRLLEHPVYGIGSIAREDSAYTMIVPTNEAWQAA